MEEVFPTKVLVPKGEPRTTPYHPDILEFDLKIEWKFIPIKLEDSYREFLESIERIPYWYEFERWEAKQINF